MKILSEKQKLPSHKAFGMCAAVWMWALLLGIVYKSQTIMLKQQYVFGPTTKQQLINLLYIIINIPHFTHGNFVYSTCHA